MRNSAKLLIVASFCLGCGERKPTAHQQPIEQARQRARDAIADNEARMRVLVELSRISAEWSSLLPAERESLDAELARLEAEYEQQLQTSSWREANDWHAEQLVGRSAREIAAGR